MQPNAKARIAGLAYLVIIAGAFKSFLFAAG